MCGENSQNFTISACYQYQEGVRRCHNKAAQKTTLWKQKRERKGERIHSKRGVPRVKIKAVNKATAESKREKWIGMIDLLTQVAGESCWGVYREFLSIEQGFSKRSFPPKRAAAGLNMIRGFVFARAKLGVDARLSRALNERRMDRLHSKAISYLIKLDEARIQ